MAKVFQFQQFAIRQTSSAMKVGTDGVLLGAWALGTPQDSWALDIGTGTGLVALQLAQRFERLNIDAIEIDPLAAAEARFNFSTSPWADRCYLLEQSFADFCLVAKRRYDLIVCNPPYFSPSRSENIQRSMARQAHHLPYQQLIGGVEKMLTPQGHFSLIVPTDYAEKIIDSAKTTALHLIKNTAVKGHIGAPVKRQLLCFSPTQRPVEEDELVLEISRHQKTDAYQALVQDFYLPKS